VNMPKYFCSCAPLNMVGDIIATRVSELGGKNVIVLYR